MRSTFALAAAALGSAALFAGNAHAGTGGTLGWSYAEVGVGSCNQNGGCTAAHPPVYIGRPIDTGFNHNSSVSLSDALRGSADARADVGATFLSMPELHSEVVGAPFANGAYSWNYSFTEGVIGYRWDGPDTMISLDTFVGTLEYSSNAQSFGFANASLALLNNAVEDPAIGNLWGPTNNGSFRTDCSSPGAGGIARTGLQSATGNITAVAQQQCSGTFELVQGQNFYLWAQMETFIAGDGFVNANNTFKIDFAPTADPTVVQLIQNNAVVIPGGGVGGIPEPSAWGLFLLGFGALGAALRGKDRRRAWARRASHILASRPA